MNKKSPSRGKYSFVTTLFAGAIILGIGTITWAMFGIWDQSRYLSTPAFKVSSDMASNSPIVKDALLDENSTTNPAGEMSSASYEEMPSASPASKINLYPDYPEEGDLIGSLSIPSLNKDLPIIEGTGTDDLKKGVGHFFQSALPGENNNCVLSGHRDTVFVGLGSLMIGEQVIVQTSAGTFTYKISSIRIVHKDDKTVIVPSGHAVLTLTTCYPFHYVGLAPDRYIITADMVD